MASENRIEGHTKAEQLELLHFAAERNHANALFTLGQIYGKGKETGFDVEQSHEVGLKYYERAANEGHTHAAYWTGYSYRQGLGVAVSDPAKAIVFLEQAAKADMISALFDLGVIYHVGEGVPKDLKKAVEYYEKAAKLGAHPAMYNLGMILMAGEDGVPRDLPRANALLRAARDGNPAQYPLPEQQLAAAEAQAERDAEAVRAALRGVMRGKEEPAGSAASAAKERAAVDGSAGAKNQDADMGQLVLGGAVAMGLCAIGFFAFKQIFGKR
jgi:TPR repeat protein